MFRRLFLTIFLTLFGLGVGLAVGAILMRRWEKTTARTASQISPDNVAVEVGNWIGGLRHRWNVMRAAGAQAAADREAELRERYGVPTVAEAAGRAEAENRRRRG